MVTKELISYIKKAHEAGNLKSDTVKTLKEQGWISQDIEHAYQKALSLPDAPSFPHSVSDDTELLDPGVLISQAISLGKQRFWTLLGIMAFGWVIGLVAVIVILLLLVLAGFGIGISSIAAESVGVAILTSGFFIIITILSVIGFIVLGVWIQAALTIGGLGYRENIGVFEAYKQAWHRIGAFFGTSMLGVSAMVGGFLLFFFPGILLMVWLFTSLYIVLAENKGGMAALVQAKNYTRGRWWSIFGRILVLWAVQIGIWVIILILSLFASDDFQPIVYNLLNWITSLIFVPFSMMYMIRLYETMRGSYKPSGDESSGKGTILTFIILSIILPIIYIVVIIAIVASLPKDTFKDFEDTVIDKDKYSESYESVSPSRYRDTLDDEDYY